MDARVRSAQVRAHFALRRQDDARWLRAAICRLYAIDDARISDWVEYDPGYAIKFTFYRPQPSGSAGDPDIFGSQQYAPLLDVEVPTG